MTRALVVLSGGQDSSTCLFWAKKHFDEVHAITFDYNQHHRREIEAARAVAKIAGVADRHEVLVVGDILASASPLTNSGAALETYQSFTEMEGIIGDRVEKTFVPMRNAFFLTLAANRAVAIGEDCELVTGVCQADNANYPDCRQEFIDAQGQAIRLALGIHHFAINTPLMDMSKAASIKLALSLPWAYEALAFTHTAYSGEFPPVTQDHATVLRAQGFLEAGWPDPLIIRAWNENALDLPKTSNYDDMDLVRALAVRIDNLEPGL